MFWRLFGVLFVKRLFLASLKVVKQYLFWQILMSKILLCPQYTPCAVALESIYRFCNELLTGTKYNAGAVVLSCTLAVQLAAIAHDAAQRLSAVDVPQDQSVIP